MSEPIARLEAEDIARNITEIDSLCMNCREQGQTRLLPTRIPYFREVIVTSFSCPHCGFENCELMPAASYDDLGMRFELKVETKADLNRQVAQAKFATIRIPELDLEVPSTRGSKLNSRFEMNCYQGLTVVSFLRRSNNGRRSVASSGGESERFDCEDARRRVSTRNGSEADRVCDSGAQVA